MSSDDSVAEALEGADVLADMTPWPEPAPVMGAVLEDVTAFLRRFVAFASPHQVTVCALWIAHTHVYDRFDVSPFLHLSSPEKQSGKTRLLEVSEQLVRDPWRVVSPSEAVLFRMIDAKHPTLLLDEVDTIFGRGRDDAHEPLRALLNAGNRRGVRVPRCVGDGKNIRIAEFSVFTPRVLAGIGTLPDTVADRSIPIRLQRRAAHETVERFRFRDVPMDAHPIREALQQSMVAAGDILQRARPAVPEILSDRAAELWEPLLAIADLAGGDWPDRARAAAVAIHGDPLAQDDTTGVALLRAIREAFEETGTGQITTVTMLTALVGRDDGPWAEWWGKAVAAGEHLGPAARLSRILRQYKITSRTIRTADDRAKGYVLADFEDVFNRYAPSLTPKSRDTVTTLDTQGSVGQNGAVTGSPCHDPEIARKPVQDKTCHGVTALDSIGGGATTQQADAGDYDDLLKLAGRYGWPRLEFHAGQSIMGGETAWTLFATHATPGQRFRATSALVAGGALDVRPHPEVGT